MMETKPISRCSSEIKQELEQVSFKADETANLKSNILPWKTSKNRNVDALVDDLQAIVTGQNQGNAGLTHAMNNQPESTAFCEETTNPPVII